MNLLPGELVALVQVEDAGQWRTAAVIATHRGPVVGVLLAPEGRSGHLRFEPVPALLEALAGHEAVEQARSIERASDGVDPNDPRGLRAGGRSRRAGMTS